MSEFWRHASLPWLESRYSQASTACYGKHSHPTVSIGLVEAGSATVEVDGCNIAIGPVDLVTFNAGQVHACNPRTNSEWSYHMLYFDLAWWQTIVTELSGDRALAEFLSPVVTSADLCADLRNINCALRSAKGQEINRLELELLSWVNRFLSELAASKKDPVLVKRPLWLEAVENHIKAHARETIKLDNLCQLAGLSKGALIRQFKQHTGLTPTRICKIFVLTMPEHS